MFFRKELYIIELELKLHDNCFSRIVDGVADGVRENFGLRAFHLVQWQEPWSRQLERQGLQGGAVSGGIRGTSRVWEYLDHIITAAILHKFPKI